jgi:hypothetical protein
MIFLTLCSEIRRSPAISEISPAMCDFVEDHNELFKSQVISIFKPQVISILARVRM